MARDESSIPSSGASFDKRCSQLNSKLTILNRDFVKFIYEEVLKDAEIDLTPSVTSYINEVNNLRRMYNLELGNSSNTPTDGVIRKKAIARRRKDISSIDGDKGSRDRTIPSLSKSPVLKMSTPSGSSAPNKLEMSSDISAISPFGGFGGLAHKKLNDGDETLKTTSTIEAPSSAAGGRKRAIRGGGILGDSESIVFRGSDNGGSSSISTPTITVKPPPINFTLPKGSADFWSSKAKTDNEDKKDDKKEETKNESKPFTFGSSAPKFTGFSFGSSSSPSTSSSSTTITSTTTTSSSVNLFGNIKPMSSSSSSSTPPLLSFNLPKPTDGMPLSFPSSTPKPFGTTSTTNTDGTSNDDDQEGEYVPPKVEVVENEEPDAVMSIKCACFKLVEKEYKKLGVGMLHIKDKEGVKSLLIRAGTTTGAIFVNNRIDATMSTEKAADNKLRVSVPSSSTQIDTFLIQVNKDDCPKILDKLKESGAKSK